MMEVFRNQMLFLWLGKAISLKGSHGFSSLASHGQWSPRLVTPQTYHEVTLRVWAMDLASEGNRFLVLIEIKNSLHFLIKGVTNLV
jgi:hypothetical protein